MKKLDFVVVFSQYTEVPTARYADFMAMLEIARMYPDRIPPEVVIANSNLANKEVIAQQVKTVNNGGKVQSSKGSKLKRKFRPTKDLVNILTQPQASVIG